MRRGEVVHAVRAEMAQRLSDVVFRRTDLGTAGRPSADALVAAASIMADVCGWSPEQERAEMEQVRAAYAPLPEPAAEPGGWAGERRVRSPSAPEPGSAGDWALRLFDRSVLKQAKYRQIVAAVGDTAGKRCLDLGSDNGVISYLLRRRGGSWASADLDRTTVEAIRGLVRDDVHQIDGRRLPFDDASFDVVVVVDLLEHVADDAGARGRDPAGAAGRVACWWPTCRT